MKHIVTTLTELQFVYKPEVMNHLRSIHIHIWAKFTLNICLVQKYDLAQKYYTSLPVRHICLLTLEVLNF